MLLLISNAFSQNAPNFQNTTLYSVSTNGTDVLHQFDFNTKTWTSIGETGTENLKALEFDNHSKTLYGIDEGKFGTIDLATGQFSNFGVINSGEGEYGTLVLDDIQDLAFDMHRKILYAVHRVAGNGPGTNDVIFKIDPTTGLIIKNTLRDNSYNLVDLVDYVIIDEVFNTENGEDLYDISGISYDPYTHQFFAIHMQQDNSATQDYNEAVISELEISSEEILLSSIIYDTPLSNMHDLCYGGNGEFYAIQSSLNAIIDSDRVEAFNLATLSSTAISEIEPVGSSNNFRSLACSYSINDLALKLSTNPNQTLPISEEDIVTFDVTVYNVYNQGEVTIDEINLVSYISDDVYLEDDSWFLIDNTAYKTLFHSLEPGASVTTTLQIEVKEDFEGEIRMAAEIVSVFSNDFYDDKGNPIALPDIDSYYNEYDDETNISDNDINGGILNNEDEDDHDIEIVYSTINFQSVDCACFSVAQNNGLENELFGYDTKSNKWHNIGKTGTNNIKALTYVQSTNSLLGIEQGKLGTIDVTTGEFTSFGFVNSGEGPYGTLVLDNIEGLAYDPQLEVLFAVHRVPGDGPGTNDVLFQIDPETGLINQNAMTDPVTGNLTDYVTIDEAFLGENVASNTYDVYGIIYNPYTQQLLALQTKEGAGQTLLTELDKKYGYLESVIFDEQSKFLNGLALSKDGQYFAIGTYKDNLSELISYDAGTGETSDLGSIDPTGTSQDFQSLACQAPVNDLALKIECPELHLPVIIADGVGYNSGTLNFTIYNQGEITIDEFSLNVYLTNEIYQQKIEEDGWFISGNVATKNFNKLIKPGEYTSVALYFSVKDDFEGLLKLAAEIGSAYNYDITDSDGNAIPLSDIDSYYDDLDQEIYIEENEINGKGANRNEDEDDHDITYIQVINEEIAVAHFNNIQSPCYAVAYNNGAVNTLSVYNQDENFWYIVDVLETTGIKAIAVKHTPNVIYAIENGILGTINATSYSANFSPIGSVNGGNGDYGNLTLDNIYGLTYSTDQNILYASHRITGNDDSSNDVVFQIDPSTGQIIPNAMLDNLGNPADYAVVPTFVDHGIALNELKDVTELTINPFTGKLYAIISNENVTNQLVEINKQTAEFENTIASWDENEKLGSVTFISEYELYATLYQPNGATQLILTDILNHTNTSLGLIDKNSTVTDFLSIDCSEFACVDEMYISETIDGQGEIISGNYQAGNKVKSDGVINGNNQNVTYKAGIEINLEAGFEVKQGSEFFADIENCDFK